MMHSNNLINEYQTANQSEDVTDLKTFNLKSYIHSDTLKIVSLSYLI